MATDPLAGRLITAEDLPPEPEGDLHEEGDPPDSPGAAAPVLAPSPPPAPAARDEKGVEWKNRTMEARRKLSKADRKAQDLADENARLRAELQARTEAPAAAAVVTQPAVHADVPAPPWDFEALKRAPVAAWPEDALLALKKESPAQWGARVDTILRDRQADDVVARVKRKENIERMDTRLVGAYPSMQDRTSPLYKEAAKVTNEWGINLEQSPLALEGIVQEAAKRLNVQPKVVETRRVTGRTSLAPELPESAAVPAPHAQREEPVVLDATQLQEMKRMGVDPEKYEKEVRLTNMQPLVSAGSGS